MKTALHVLVAILAALLTSLVVARPAQAQNQEMMSHDMAHAMTPADCSEMEVWDYVTSMCTPLAMEGMPMRQAMLHGNLFGVGIFEERRRGKDALAFPNMFMLDIGQSVGASHYVNLEWMGTLEKWTLPTTGYPELLQIGEQNDDHHPYIDAQHPHSSPIMGLTLSDTIRLGENKNHLKIFFAPRGAATEGPVAFMHRLTGVINPDAPLGHHIGQDVGHITSTVLGTEIAIGSIHLELSTFNGEEPEPTHVDLPIGPLNSWAARLTQELLNSTTVMVSAAYVQGPEPHDPSIGSIRRYSASMYQTFHLENGWMFHNTLIYGLVNGYDHVASLSSLGEEFRVHDGNRNDYWGRFEVLQRSGDELNISGLQDSLAAKWVTALTLGYTRQVLSLGDANLALGGAVTKDILPAEFRGAYGGDPVAAKVFLQLSGMKMWDLM